MDGVLRARLDSLYAEGGRHDAGEADRLRRRRNLEPETAELLAMLVRVAAAEHDEVAEFLALVGADPGTELTTVAIGKGLALAWLRDRDPIADRG
ncbi:hypothetical protein [Cryptosporangium sp. NPDC051539]|uniref:hypothetical protein n=1 Tax=Cryptosporangium sp. NPDC051539 TaxID=3363962 RepID=UPI00379E5EB3